jgi:hypothetical protein
VSLIFDPTGVDPIWSEPAKAANADALGRAGCKARHSTGDWGRILIRSDIASLLSDKIYIFGAETEMSKASHFGSLIEELFHGHS